MCGGVFIRTPFLFLLGPLVPVSLDPLRADLLSSLDHLLRCTLHWHDVRC